MRTFDEINAFCLSLTDAVLEFPFDAETPVFKTSGKMFCLVGRDGDHLRINLKCDPELALSLRDSFPAITPGYHMNKAHWNSVRLDGTLEEDKIRWMITHSHSLVHKKLHQRPARA
jgi:predicted DNA-binding protein (MmcQ/YjbR family)